jgi:hypothetical protein
MKHFDCFQDNEETETVVRVMDDTGRSGLPLSLYFLSMGVFCHAHNSFLQLYGFLPNILYISYLFTY